MADKVTLESLDARMDKTDARMDKTDKRLDHIEADIGSLKTDVGTLKTDVGTLKTDVGTLKNDVATLGPQMLEVVVAVRRLDADRNDLGEQIEELTLQATSLAAATMEAVTQLALSRNYEKRLTRLETAVFGKAD